MPGHILVIDDDPLVLTMLRRVLTSGGFGVHEAAEADGAMTVLARTSLDLVLCDVRLPGRDGFELLHEIRRTHPGTDVVLMTGYGSVDGAVDAMSNGAADYLIKPLRPKEIIARVNAIFERRLLQKQLRELESALRLRDGNGHATPTNGSGAVAPIAKALGDRERQLVVEAVHKHPGHLDQAARELGISRTTLWRRMRKYGIPSR